MSTVLVTGCNGFLGSHLADLLVERGETVIGVVHRGDSNVRHLAGRLRLVHCDILDQATLTDVLATHQPEIIVHLAAQSLPALAWRDPRATFRTNVDGTLSLLEAVHAAGNGTRVIVVGSSLEYGRVEQHEIPLREEQPLRPADPYGVSKTAQYLLGNVYRQTFGLRLMHVRPFAIVGTRKTGDACSDFARGITAVERRERDTVTVGNLDVVRDFLDVRDAARALITIAERGEPGLVYNVCSGSGRSLREILEAFVASACRPVRVEVDPGRLRPADQPVLIGANDRLRSLGWRPEIPLEKTLAWILTSWRVVAAAAATAETR